MMWDRHNDMSLPHTNDKERRPPDDMSSSFTVGNEDTAKANTFSRQSLKRKVNDKIISYCETDVLWELCEQSGMNRGMRSTGNIGPGQSLGEYEGDVVYNEEEMWQRKSDRVVQLGGRRKAWLIGYDHCEAGHVNHGCGKTGACAANTELVWDDCITNGKRKLILTTNKEVKRGCFFLLDYGFRYKDGFPKWMKGMKCSVCEV
jgi:hypothetical protein